MYNINMNVIKYVHANTNINNYTIQYILQSGFSNCLDKARDVAAFNHVHPGNLD
jgi:hypothetical protein